MLLPAAVPLLAACPSDEARVSAGASAAFAVDLAGVPARLGGPASAAAADSASPLVAPGAVDEAAGTAAGTRGMLISVDPGARLVGDWGTGIGARAGTGG